MVGVLAPRQYPRLLVDIIQGKKLIPTACVVCAKKKKKATKNYGIMDLVYVSLFLKPSNPGFTCEVSLGVEIYKNSRYSSWSSFYSSIRTTMLSIFYLLETSNMVVHHKRVSYANMLCFFLFDNKAWLFYFLVYRHFCSLSNVGIRNIKNKNKILWYQTYIGCQARESLSLPTQRNKLFRMTEN